MTKILSEEQKISRVEAIKALQQRILNCRLCEEQGFIPIARPLVGGRPGDRVMVIGQAPGHRSVAKGRSFSGPGGTILQKWLEQAGFLPGYLHSHAAILAVIPVEMGTGVLHRLK